MRRVIFSITVLALLAPYAAFAAIGSPYPASNLGYDVSYATHAYPAVDFSFAIVGVSGGKAFTKNPRLISEYNWARFGSATAPTLYMNLNAPYGSTVAGHIGSPQSCLPRASATTTEPTACEGYNYGYTAAVYAWSHAKSKGIESPLWWLDIELENSWSKDTAVNAATIQGAIDALNARSVRVGVYSMPFMWKKIAGSFVPMQRLQGASVTTPLWLPVGIRTLVGAINTCVLGMSFISGSPIWLVQYVADGKAIDQNLAC